MSGILDLPCCLVYGGRDFDDRNSLWDCLDEVRAYYSQDLLIMSGAARGADLLALGWARDRQVPYLGVPAMWDAFGEAAGQERNERMPKLVTPTLALECPGGTGTRNMAMILARDYNITPWRPFP